VMEERQDDVWPSPGLVHYIYIIRTLVL